MKRLAVLVVLIAVVAAGCGDDKKKDGANASDAKTEQTTPGATPSTDASGNTTPRSGGTNPTTPGGGTTNPGGGTNTTQAGGGSTTTKPPFPVELRLEKKCVVKGALGDSQVLTAKTRPGDTVAWSTEYSDHSNELSKPEYKETGGSGYGKADGEGNFKTEWKVPPTAPDGTARVHAIADNRIHPPLEFKVVSNRASC